MNLRILLNAFDCRNRDSFWRKGTCNTLLFILFICIFAPIVVIPTATLIISMPFVLFGVVVMIIQIVCRVSILTGLDFSGELYTLVHDLNEMLFSKNFNNLKNHSNISYENLGISASMIVGASIVVILIIASIVCVAYLFGKDIKNHGTNIYKQRSFMYLCIVIILYLFIAIFPLLFNIIAGLFNGVAIIIDWSPIGANDNHAVYNHFVIMITDNTYHSFYETLFIVSSIVGCILIISIILFIPGMLIRYCIVNCKKDIEESYNDIETGEIYAQEKEL